MPTISTALNQAILQVQAMPAEKQQEIFDFIDFIALRDIINQPPTQKSSKTDLQKQFIVWRKKHEQALQSLDETWDDDWADVRDRNEFGREFSWE